MKAYLSLLLGLFAGPLLRLIVQCERDLKIVCLSLVGKGTGGGALVAILVELVVGDGDLRSVRIEVLLDSRQDLLYILCLGLGYLRRLGSGCVVLVAADQSGRRAHAQSNCKSQIFLSHDLLLIVIDLRESPARYVLTEILLLCTAYKGKYYISTSILSRCQMSSTYSWMVLSEENLPELATFRMADLAQPFSSRYFCSILICAS